jgi:hypothetical protein
MFLNHPPEHIKYQNSFDFKKVKGTRKLEEVSENMIFNKSAFFYKNNFG